MIILLLNLFVLLLVWILLVDSLSHIVIVALDDLLDDLAFVLRQRDVLVKVVLRFNFFVLNVLLYELNGEVVQLVEGGEVPVGLLYWLGLGAREAV